MKQIILPTILLFLLSISGCQSTPVYTYSPPEVKDDGFQVSTIDEVDIDREMVIKAVDRISRGRYGDIHSVLIYKDRKLVLEEYFEGHKFTWDESNYKGEFVLWDSDMQHVTMSVSKSFTSLCVGIAIDEGYIESVDQSIFDYLPEHQHLNKDGKDKITIEHLLTMTSGLQWDEWGAPLSSKANDIIGMWYYGQEDPLSFILERPLAHEPGTHFTYHGGGMFVLAEIIRHATGMYIDEFSGKYVFSPLGTDSFNWATRYKNGEIDAAGSLMTTPRNMLKMGATFLDDGIWHGNRIISEQWVEKSAVIYGNNKEINVPHSTSGRRGYSYTWWTKEYPETSLYFASGWGGQHIIVMPNLDAVVVFTAGMYSSQVKTFNVFTDYLIPALSRGNS